MKNLIVLAVATLFATNAVAAEMKWNGSAGWRYSQTSNDDSLGATATDGYGNKRDVSVNKTRAHQARANLGVTGGWEHVEYGVGVRTQNRGTGGFALTTNDDYASVGNNQDLGLGVEQAWFRYVRDFGSVDVAATIGRQKLALVTDTQWETLFDNDVRFDGFGWNFKFGMFGFNAAQYILGSNTSNPSPASATAGTSAYSSTEFSQGNAPQRFSTLFAFQPYMNWKFSDEIEAMLAISYYKWNASGLTANTTGGGVNAAATNTAASTVPALAAGAYKLESPSQWDFLANVSLPMNFMFTGDLVKANKAYYNNLTVAGYAGNVSTQVNSTAWTLGLTYGKLRKAQDFTLGYAYGTKGIGSVYSIYTNDKFLADNKGHTVIAGYALADNFHLGFRWMSLKEKEGVDATNATATLAGRPYAGTANANAGQLEKTNYWELTAGVAF